MMMPPIIMIGALIIIRIIMRTTICTWVTSLVVRVTREGVPILSNSWREKLGDVGEDGVAEQRRPCPWPQCEER